MTVEPITGERAKEFRAWMREQANTRGDRVGAIGRLTLRSCFAKTSAIGLYESWWTHLLNHHRPGLEETQALRTAVTEWLGEDPGPGGRPVELKLPMPAPPPTSFNQWLRRQCDRQDPVGDLARDMRDDACLPRAGKYATLRAHLVTFHDPVPAALAALRQGWKEWTGEDPEAKLPPEARWVRRFCTERLVRSSGAVPAIEVYRAFEEWCESELLLWRGGPHDFFDLAKKMGEVRRRSLYELGTDEVWVGLALSPR